MIFALALTCALVSSPMGSPGRDPGHLRDLNEDWDLLLQNLRVTRQLDPSQKAFDSDGVPSVIRHNSEGFQVSARRFSGEFTQISGGEFNLDRIFAEIDVVADYNSDEARSWQLKNGLKPSMIPGVTTRLTSLTLLFNQLPNDDKLTLDHPFLLTDHRSGKNESGSFETSSTMTGTQGVIHANPATKALPMKLRTADISGPVHFHQIKTTSDPKTGKPIVTEYDLVGDHLTVDQISPERGVITLNGHAKFIETGDKGGAIIDGTKISAFTDSDNNIVDYELTNGHAVIPIKPESPQ